VLVVENQVDDAEQWDAEVFAGDRIDQRSFERRFDCERLRFLVTDVIQVTEPGPGLEGSGDRFC
jgi:hypothetical protein